MEGCVFCGIVAGKVPAKIVYQDEKIFVIADIRPKANLHLLIIPKNHTRDLSELDDSLFLGIKNEIVDIVNKERLIEKGYRVVVNGGRGKAIDHLHFHLLGGVGADREI